MTVITVLPCYFTATYQMHGCSDAMLPIRMMWKLTWMIRSLITGDGRGLNGQVTWRHADVINST